MVEELDQHLNVVLVLDLVEGVVSLQESENPVSDDWRVPLLQKRSEKLPFELRVLDAHITLSHVLEEKLSLRVVIQSEVLPVFQNVLVSNFGSSLWVSLSTLVTDSILLRDWPGVATCLHILVDMPDQLVDDRALPLELVHYVHMHVPVDPFETVPTYELLGYADQLGVPLLLDFPRQRLSQGIGRSSYGEMLVLDLRALRLDRASLSLRSQSTSTLFSIREAVLQLKLA